MARQYTPIVHRHPISPLAVNIARLARRPGAVFSVQETVPSPSRIGVELIAIQRGAPLDLDLRLESVSEGVLVTGTVAAPTTGECARCLETVNGRVEVALTELFAYPDSTTDATTDEDEVGRVVDDIVDLEQSVIDAVGLELPFSPVCRTDCPGLCPECGVPLATAEPGHHHDEIDPRWATLAGLLRPDDDGAQPWSSLLDALGVDLPDELLTLALTHRSYAYEHGGLPTNERLEFLGDAVLGLIVTYELFHRHPDRPEGDLAKLRSSVVNTQALAEVARNLTDQGLGAHLLLGRGEANSGGADKSSILADSMESLLGAIYLHHGMDAARDVILRLLGALLDAGGLQDWKTSLQELTAARGLGAPSYQVSSTGPDHDREFTAVVVVMDTEYGSGVGRTKKEAEQKAAAAAWNAIDSA
jgi:ribonuclease-3